MNIVRRDETSREPRFLTLRDAINRLMEESFWDPFESASFGLAARVAFPKVDVSETEDEVKIVANLPGIDPDKVEIQVTEDSVTLAGKIEKESEEKGRRVYRYEREYGEFSRTLSLPATVDPNKVNAKAKHGVLTITLPKSERERPKKVKVQAE